MAYKIGDKVLAKHTEGAFSTDKEAVIADRMYSEKSDKFFYSIRFKGCLEEEDDLYDDGDLRPFVEEKVEYDIKAEISEGVIIFSVIATKGMERTLVARGHGHMLRNDLLGVVQAASWAARKALTDLNGGNTYIEKEN
jgi:hypothetical protein